MQLWTNIEGGCWSACLASLVDVHPGDVPHDDDDLLDVERMNDWLASCGRRLVPVLPAGTWGDSYPNGRWIALLARSPGVAHAVLCGRGQVMHDPAFSNGWSGSLWPNELAHAYNRTLPLGYEVVAA